MLVKVLKDVLAYSGFFRLRRLTVTHELFSGGMSDSLEREVLEHSDVAAAVLFDPILGKCVMIEQFRAGVYAAGLDPWLIDIVAGRIEKGQSPVEAVTREIEEEFGLTPLAIEPIGRYLTAPHLSSERVYLFSAQVDASKVGGTHGLSSEGEDIRPVVMDRAETLRLMQTHTLSLWAGTAVGCLFSHSAKTMSSFRAPE
ncbi:MAG: NUDIX domain-containing protein [Sterolibacterium sp.]